MSTENKTDFQKLSSELRILLDSYGLMPGKFGLILHIPKQTFELLSQQNPRQHPRLILITPQDDEWFVQVQPILEPGDYPTGNDLKPDSFQKMPTYKKPKSRAGKSRSAKPEDSQKGVS